jgi:hypothetical protein
VRPRRGPDRFVGGALRCAALAASLALASGELRAEGPNAPSAAPSPSSAPPRAADPQSANPHAANPNGGAAMQRRMYQPPPDGSEVDPSMPRGTLVVAIRDANDAPVAGAPVELAILHASVAQGDRRESRSATTSAEGLATFSGLDVGTAHSYVVKSTRGEASYATPPASLPEQGGLGVVLHVFDASKRLEDTTLFSRAFVDVSMKDDVLIVEQRAEIANASPVAWLADYELALPAGFTAFTAAEGMKPPMVATERGARLVGTVPPGITSIGFRYHLPLEKDGDQSFSVASLPHTAFVRVAAEASKKMSLDADGFAKAERLTDRTGKSFLVAQRKWTPQEGAFIDRFEVRFAGLPARGWGAYLAASLAAVALAVGGTYAWHRRGARELADDSRDDLVEAREALLAELAELERAAKRGEVGPKSYARLRQAMLDALARILALLEGDVVKVAAVAPSGASTDHDTRASRDERATEEASDDDAEVRAARARKRKTGVRRAP